MPDVYWRVRLASSPKAVYELLATGADLTVEGSGVPPDWTGENRAGWVSVLIAVSDN